MDTRIEDALAELRENRRDHPPKVEREGHHVKVVGDGEHLDEDFKSSGT